MATEAVMKAIKALLFITADPWARNRDEMWWNPSKSIRLRPPRAMKRDEKSDSMSISSV